MCVSLAYSMPCAEFSLNILTFEILHFPFFYLLLTYNPVIIQNSEASDCSKKTAHADAR